LAVDYSKSVFPKGRNPTQERADRRAELAAKDRAENAKAKQRAGGRCEVVEAVMFQGKPHIGFCARRDAHTHHLIGGNGRRNHGKSILADYKLRVCHQCHDDIHAKILKPTTAEHDAHTVRFWRAR
jgi:hypothetical protein